MPSVNIKVGAGNMQVVLHKNFNKVGGVPESCNSEKFASKRAGNVGEPLNLEKMFKARKPKLPTWAQNLSYYFTDYCEATGIHGFRYLGERGRLLIEKLVWSIVIAVVGYFCISLILKAYNKWVTSPVIVTFATTETAIWDIPFPAVTVCPEVKTNPEIFNYTDVFLKKFVRANVSSQEERYFESLSLICRGLAGEEEFAAMFHNANLTLDESAMDDLINVLPLLNWDWTQLFWLGRECDFNETVSETFTSEGLCYSFNMLDFNEILVDPEEYVMKRAVQDTQSRKWSLEEGYPSGEKMDTFPRRTFISGINGGLVMNLYTNHSHLDYLCGEALQGYQITIHHPSQLPNMDRHFRLPLDQAVLVAIKPRMITVSEELKMYKPEIRKCYFSNERRLTFFKGYTQQNCLHECFSNYTLMKCGCVAFYMPSKENDSSPICGFGSKGCLDNSKVRYLLERAGSKMDDYNSDCGCLPSCTSLEYDVEISQTEWNWRESFEVFTHLGSEKHQLIDFDYKNTHISKLAVYYREMQFLSSKRQEIYGSMDFFSNTGGLLGLFIGFSITSAIEILYFLTLRLACNIRMFGADFWSGRRST